MVDITFKQHTLRTAIAEAFVKCSADAIRAIEENNVPKGNVLEIARAAGLFAVKKTSDLIPDCHPLPVEATEISYDIDKNNNRIQITIRVRTEYKTGVEVEAMHGASVVALTIYDMLKPIDKTIEIQSIRLRDKTGGKSSVKNIPDGLKAAVIVASDRASKGETLDRTGKAIQEQLKKYSVETIEYQVIPDEKSLIREKVIDLIFKEVAIIIVTGGTGVSERDVSPEAIGELIEKELPGVMETARRYGQSRTPYAMLSRGIAGTANRSLLLALPGSVNGATETIEAIFPGVLHVFNVMDGKAH